ncbi:GntR family transcriptional regulator [Rhizobium sp. LjRoot30]|uniref:GntR family transcriptional regulator n=1 Tax=Rhizobium sp. LjRoot30 TaxID=3342320 RepID=UPI003ECC2680
MRPIERPPSLVDTVAAQLRELIVSGELALGQQLSERNLAAAFGVSKTPVREALAQLKTEGLVRIAAQRGATVFTLSGQEVADICEWRQTLETAALRMAFERACDRLVADLAKVVERMKEARGRDDVKAYLAEDTAFHNVIFQCCGNRLFLDTYDLMQAKIAALRTHLSVKPHHTDRSFEEHGEIVEKLRGNDLDAALACLTVHIDRSRTTYSLATADISTE